MKIRFLLLFSLFALVCQGQNNKSDSIPGDIQKAFTAEYPDSKMKSWELKNDTWFINTKIDGQDARASFSASGLWIETVFQTNVKELPGRISNYITTKHPGYQIIRSDYTESKNNGAFYYIQINKSGQEPDAELFFDVSGNFMKKNDFHPIDNAISTGRQAAEARKAAEEAEKKAAYERRQELLNMDRTVYENEIPVAILNNFKKKFPKVEDVHWDSLDNIYSAHYVVDEYNFRVDFKPEGDWLATMEELSMDVLYTPVLKYLDENYSDLRFQLCEKTTRRDRSVTYYIELINKVRKGEEPLVTKLYFDKNGKLTKEESPKVARQDDNDGEEITSDSEDNANDSGINEGDNEIARGEKIEAKELPSSIKKYVDVNYPRNIIKEAIFDNFDDYGNAYQVKISKEGLNQKIIELYFSDKGKLLYDPNPTVKKESTPSKATTAPKKKEVVVDDEDEEEEDDQPASNAFAAREDDVPAVIRKNFTKRFPKAEEVEWYENDGKFEVEFYNNDNKTRLGFSNDGVVQVTKTEMNPGALMGPIMRILDDKYPQYKISYAEKVIRKDRNNYFYVELFTKKRNVTPSELQLYFDKVGRLMEVAPE